MDSKETSKAMAGLDTVIASTLIKKMLQRITCLWSGITPSHTFQESTVVAFLLITNQAYASNAPDFIKLFCRLGLIITT